MPIIKSISFLREKSDEISELVNTANEPVFIEKEGESKMVILSVPLYRHLIKRTEVYMKLAESEMIASEGDKGKDYETILKELRKKYNGE